MRRILKLIFVVSALIGWALGCSQNTSTERVVIASQPDPHEPAEIEIDAEVPLSNLPESTVATMNSKVQVAMAKKDYHKAVKIVIALARVNGMSPEQHVALRNSIQNVKVELAEASLSGDTNAVEAIRYFRNNSAAGR
jgi:hypothetical protein